MKICNQYTVNFYYGWHFLLLFLRVLVDRGVARSWALVLSPSFPKGIPRVKDDPWRLRMTCCEFKMSSE